MNKNGELYNKLIEYSKDGKYPLHMPGHKRNIDFFKNINPYDIDITEITDFDNLHCSNGIIKKMTNAAENYYGTDKSYFLVNGSSCGILAAIFATTSFGDKALVGRNCHKSVYNAILLKNLDVTYLYPSFVEEYQINGGYDPKEIDSIMKSNSNIKTVVITSPTYDGIVSDIKKISEIVHSHGGILIVDSAHGAHFILSNELPKSSYELGADIVIESLHKTLPAFTQTAIMHVMGDRVNKNKVDNALSIFETSSPSYVFMASIDMCLKYMEQHGKEKMERLLTINNRIIKKVNNLKHIRTISGEIVGKYNIYDTDITKLAIFVDERMCSGEKLGQILRNDYNFEMEMYGYNYVLGITTICDDEKELDRFANALEEIDDVLSKESNILDKKDEYEIIPKLLKNQAKYSIFQCEALNKEKIRFEKSEGSVSGEYVFLYPPGIPLIVPGEIISKELIEQIKKYKELKMNILGIEDKKIEQIYVLE